MRTDNLDPVEISVSEIIFDQFDLQPRENTDQVIKSEDLFKQFQEQHDMMHKIWLLCFWLSSKFASQTETSYRVLSKQLDTFHETCQLHCYSNRN